MIHQIDATVLFVRDLPTCQAFYRDTLGFQMTGSDPDSITFRLGDRYFLLLEASAATRLLGEEVKIAGGPRWLLAAGVEDVDADYETLLAKGVTFLRPPTSQPWGLRTAHFTDPEGNVWEINQPIEASSGK